MKLKTAALIAIVGNILGLILTQAHAWHIIPFSQLGWSLGSIFTTGTLIIFLITIFNKSK
jgi:hypothetical protein